MGLHHRCVQQPGSEPESQYQIHCLPDRQRPDRDPHSTVAHPETAQDTSGFGFGFGIGIGIGKAYLSTTPGTGWQLPFNLNGFLSLQHTAVTAPVPEPGSYGLLLAGLGLIGAAVKRRKVNKG